MSTCPSVRFAGRHLQDFSLPHLSQQEGGGCGSREENQVQGPKDEEARATQELDREGPLGRHEPGQVLLQVQVKVVGRQG